MDFDRDEKEIAGHDEILNRGRERLWTAVAAVTETKRGSTASCDSNISLRSEVTNVLDLLFFADSPNLLRASQLKVVMKDWAAILRSNQGSAATYEMSMPVKHINAFISHSWQKWWAQKFVCLAMHFHFRTTFNLFVFITLCISVPIQIAGVHTQVEVILGLKIVSMPLFLALLFRGDFLRRFVRRGETMVFLDKTCIHQESHELQQQGIRKLGAFLNMSHTMVVLYSDIYLERLWTVYEMATWVLMKEVQHMIIIPQFLPWVVLLGLIVPYFSNIMVAVYTLLYPANDEDTGMENQLYAAFEAQVLIDFLSSQVLLWWCRRFAFKQIGIYKRMSKFDVKESKCFQESDRATVEQSICSIMRALGTVAKDCSDEEALKAFNSIVKVQLPRVVQQSLGKHLGLSYWHLLACAVIPRLVEVFNHSIPAILSTDWMSCEILDDGGSSCGSGELSVLWILYVIVVEPVRFAFMIRWCTCCLRMKGLAAFIYIESIWAMFICILIASLLSVKYFKWYEVFFTVAITCFTMQVFLYNFRINRCICCRRRRRAFVPDLSPDRLRRYTDAVASRTLADMKRQTGDVDISGIKSEIPTRAAIRAREEAHRMEDRVEMLLRAGSTEEADPRQGMRGKWSARLKRASDADPEDTIAAFMGLQC